ncbi:MAG: protein phosphatase 2C domain-containing protein [Gemmatimonadetes bacterium]|nr:protein phosphatase 2C domain-containing protein [Gemmatimonadota bacterium]
MLNAHSLLLPKDGLHPHECEDAIGIRSDLGRFCVADGATESFDSRTWARLLTKHWSQCNGLTQPHELQSWWKRLGERHTRRWSERPLPWYAEEKAAVGAFATFLGFEVAETTEQGFRWQAVALGDSCLVQLRGGEIVLSFPLDEADEFGSHPQLLPSKPSLQAAVEGEVRCVSGTARSGDAFLLLTDALAAWMLRYSKSEPELTQNFLRLLESASPESLADLVSNERRSRRLRNDDVAAVLLRLSAVESSKAR